MTRVFFAIILDFGDSLRGQPTKTCASFSATCCPYRHPSTRFGFSPLKSQRTASSSWLFVLTSIRRKGENSLSLAAYLIALFGMQVCLCRIGSLLRLLALQSDSFGPGACLTYTPPLDRKDKSLTRRHQSTSLDKSKKCWPWPLGYCRVSNFRAKLGEGREHRSSTVILAG